MNRRTLAALAVSALVGTPAIADTATSQSTIHNSSEPTAVVNQQTGGGINLNQQYNNQWDNHNGFAPGVYCRTPTFYLGAGTGQSNVWGEQLNGSAVNNTQVHAGVLVPFGSSVLADCARMAKALTERAEITNQASLAKTCHELKTLGVVIDPKKFPALAVCVS